MKTARFAKHNLHISDRNLQNMPDALQKLAWGSIHKYASEILVVGEFHHMNLTCDNDTTQGKFNSYPDLTCVISNRGTWGEL